MIPFHRPTLDDRTWAEPLLRAADNFASESAFGTYYLWQARYRFEIAQVGGYFVARYENGYILPAGDGEMRPLLDAIAADSVSSGTPFRVQVSGTMKERLAQAWPSALFQMHRGEADYLYRVSDLAQLTGKKYHAKRNHIARFTQNYAYTFERVTEPAQYRACMEMLTQWISTNETPTNFRQEAQAIERAFVDPAALHIRAGLLRVDGQVVAFAAGEPINDRVFDQHFEKALTSYDGAYAVINQLFASECLSDFEWVNREEDMDLDGLRKAKLSYHPDQLWMKYTAEECSL